MSSWSTYFCNIYFYRWIDGGTPSPSSASPTSSYWRASPWFWLVSADYYIFHQPFLLDFCRSVECHWQKFHANQHFLATMDTSISCRRFVMWIRLLLRTPYLVSQRAGTRKISCQNLLGSVRFINPVVAPSMVWGGEILCTRKLQQWMAGCKRQIWPRWLTGYEPRVLSR